MMSAGPLSIMSLESECLCPCVRGKRLRRVTAVLLIGWPTAKPKQRTNNKRSMLCLYAEKRTALRRIKKRQNSLTDRHALTFDH